MLYNLLPNLFQFQCSRDKIPRLGNSVLIEHQSSIGICLEMFCLPIGVLLSLCVISCDTSFGLTFNPVDQIFLETQFTSKKNFC